MRKQPSKPLQRKLTQPTWNSSSLSDLAAPSLAAPPQRDATLKQSHVTSGRSAHNELHVCESMDAKMACQRRPDDELWVVKDEWQELGGGRSRERLTNPRRTTELDWVAERAKGSSETVSSSWTTSWRSFACTSNLSGYVKDG